MGYLTRLSAGATDQPIQAKQQPPVQAAPAAVQANTPVEPADAAAKELPKAEAAPGTQGGDTQGSPTGGGTPCGAYQVGQSCR